MKIGREWSWAEFWIGKLSNKFIAWVTYMVLQFTALHSNHIPAEHTGTLLLVSAAVTFIYMLAGAIDEAVSNMKINAELKLAAEKNK